MEWLVEAAETMVELRELILELFPQGAQSLVLEQVVLQDYFEPEGRLVRED